MREKKNTDSRFWSFRNKKIPFVMENGYGDGEPSGLTIPYDEPAWRRWLGVSPSGSSPSTGGGAGLAVCPFDTRRWRSDEKRRVFSALNLLLMCRSDKRKAGLANLLGGSCFRLF
jgi:hypothetical protein